MLIHIFFPSLIHHLIIFYTDEESKSASSVLGGALGPDWAGGVDWQGPQKVSQYVKYVVFLS